MQTEYSLWTREPEIAVLDACRDNPFPDMLTAGDRAATVLRGLGIIPLSVKGVQFLDEIVVILLQPGQFF